MARLYLESKMERDQVYAQIADLALESFEKFVGRGFRPKHNTLVDWLLTYGPEEVDYAIRAAGRKVRVIDGGDGPIRYISAVLRNRAEEGSANG